MASELLPPDIYQALFERDPPPRLRPTGVYSPGLTSRIASLKINGADAPDPVLSSLHLLNDDIELAHKIAEPYYSRGVDICDYPHALVHVKEGDYGNARWWFGRITSRSHPLLVENFSPEGGKCLTVEEAGRLAKKMVDGCQKVGAGTSKGMGLEKELYRQTKATAEWSIQEYVVKAQQ